MPVRNPAACAACPAVPDKLYKGLCIRCHLKKHRPAAKCVWTSDMDDQLRQVYRRSENRTQLSAELTRLCSTLRVPRFYLANRARTLGLGSFPPRKRWTKRELLILRELAGQVSVNAIAKKLGRSVQSVKHQMFVMRQSAERTEGYTIHQLQLLLGVPNRSIKMWLNTKALKTRKDRITEESVRNFVRSRMFEFSFRRADETWLKSMLGGAGFKSTNNRLLGDMAAAARGIHPCATTANGNQ